MRRPIATSLSPNTSAADIAAAWKALLAPATWREEESVHESSVRISGMVTGRFVSLSSSGRQALYDILRVFRIGRGDEVIVQAFTCIAVPEPIIWVGATPVYADIDAKTYNFNLESLRRKITGHTKAIIVQHTFGIPGPIEEILEIARKKNIVVIEDCAHGFGGSLHGRLLGGFGDAALLSFGRDKMLSSVYGGAAIFASREHLARAQHFVGQRPFPPARWVIQQLLHPILFTALLPLYFWGFGKLFLVGAQKLGILSMAVAKEERRGMRPNHIAWQYSPALARLLLLQLGRFSTDLARRQAIVQRYQAELGLPGISLPEISAVSKPSWLRFPIQVEKRDALLAEARRHHMLFGDWYDAPLVPGDASLTAFHYTPGDCPVAEQVGRHVVNLPTYPRLTDEQVTRIIQLVKKFASK